MVIFHGFSLTLYKISCVFLFSPFFALQLFHAKLFVHQKHKKTRFMDPKTIRTGCKKQRQQHANTLLASLNLDIKRILPRFITLTRQNTISRHLLSIFETDIQGARFFFGIFWFKARPVNPKLILLTIDFVQYIPVDNLIFSEPTRSRRHPSEFVFQITSIYAPQNRLIRSQNRLICPSSHFIRPTNCFIRPTNTLYPHTNRFICQKNHFICSANRFMR